jgi:hypothetical protein
MPKINPALGGGIEPGHRRGRARNSPKATMEDRTGGSLGCKSAWSLYSGARENYLPDRRPE